MWETVILWLSNKNVPYKQKFPQTKRIPMWQSSSSVSDVEMRTARHPFIVCSSTLRQLQKDNTANNSRQMPSDAQKQ